MAIKIDLLPGYVGLKRTFSRVLLACIALFLLVAGAIGLIYMTDQRQLEKLNADVQAITPIADEATRVASAAQAATTETAPVKSVVDFMADASKTGPERAALLDLVRRYVYSGAVIENLDLSDGATARIGATVRTPDEYARFLTALRRGGPEGNGPLFASNPVGNGIPGFPEGRAVDVGAAESISYTPQPIVFPFRIDAAGALKADGGGKPLLLVPAEPPGTTVAAVGGAQGGAPGGSSSSYPSGSSSSSSSSSASASPSGSPGGSR